MTFDLFHGLAQLSKGDQQWYDKLSPEDQKAASPFVIGRWMTGTSDPAQLIRLNTFFNPYLFALGQDKVLLFKLLAASATGRTTRYKWIKGPPAAKSVRLKVAAVMQFYDVTSREAAQYMKNIEDIEIVEMAEDLGWDKEELNKLKKEVADESRTPEKPSRGKKKSN